MRNMWQASPKKGDSPHLINEETEVVLTEDWEKGKVCFFHLSPMSHRRVLWQQKSIIIMSNSI